MELAWWEATVLFVLWFVQFVFSPIPPGDTMLGYISMRIHSWITWVYLLWAGVEFIRTLVGRRKPAAFRLFRALWISRVMPRAIK